MEAAIQDRMEQFTAALNEDGEQNGSSSKDDAYSLMTELILDGRTIRAISEAEGQLLLKFPNLSKITLNQTGLSSFTGLPTLPSVKTLEATDNHISYNLAEIPRKLPNLRKLQLGGNHIKALEEVKELAQLQHLEQLGLDLNPVSFLENFRSTVFELMPLLQLLDACDRNGQEKETPDSDEEEEIAEGEDGGDEDVDTTLKDFYEAEALDDEEEGDDFEPAGDELSEDIEEDEEDECDAEEEEATEVTGKRKLEDAGETAEKHAKTQN